MACIPKPMTFITNVTNTGRLRVYRYRWTKSIAAQRKKKIKVIRLQNVQIVVSGKLD